MRKSYPTTKTVKFMAGLAFVLPACLTAQINLTATSGNTGPMTYTSLNAAFSAINQGIHQGAINIDVIGNTTEPATPTPLLKSGGTSSYTSILIKPLAGNFTIGSALAPTANRGIIELAGADNVTIDGDDLLTPGTQNLTIMSNTVTTNGIACVRLSSNSSSGADGADNNTIKNCIIRGARRSATATNTSYGIQFSDGTAASSAGTGAYASLNTLIQNNVITRCYYGIHAAGNSGTYANTGTKIIGNTIGSATPAEYVAYRGIDISYSSITPGAGSAIISQNDIRTGFTTAGANLSAVEILSSNAGILITRNNIHECINSTPNEWGMYGISIMSWISNSSITITNNFIWDIEGYPESYSGSAYGGHGIYIYDDASNIVINNNTIVQSMMGTNANIVGACITINTYGASIAQFMNNILVNNVANVSSNCIYMVDPFVISGATIDHNNYYINSMGQLVDDGSQQYPDLASWQTAYGFDANTLTEFPGFVSPTDLHLISGPLVSTNLESAGAPVSTTGVGIDFDGQSRPGPAGSIYGGGTAPDIGADEFDGKPITCPAPPSNSVIVSSITYSSATINWTNGGNESLWLMRYSAPTTSVLVFANPHNLSNLAPSTAYSVQVRAVCGTGDTSNWSMVKVFRTLCMPPMFSSVSGNTVCASGSPTLSASLTSGTASVNWYNAPSGGPILSSNPTFVPPTLTATTNYYVAAFGNTGSVSAGINYTLSNASITSDMGFGLVFDALDDFILQSVNVYPFSYASNMPGTVTIGLTDAAGNILQTMTQTVTGGPNTPANVVNLYFKISPGSYKLVLLNRTGGITDLAYHYNPGMFPLSVPGLISINYSDWGFIDTDEYLYFYNWKLLQGCEGPRVPVVAAVNPRPVVYGAASTPTVCEGTSVNLISLGSGTSFTWQPGNMSGQYATVMPASTTIYTVSAENAPNCESSATVEVVVNTKPTVNLASSNIVICAGETATLSASGTLTGYSWSNGGGSSATALVSPAANTIYSVTGYDANGCSDTRTVSVQVNAAPSLVATPSRPVICKDETVNLYALSSGISYTWSSGATTSVAAVSPSVTTSYSITAGNGLCTAKATVVVIVEACTGISSAGGAASGISVYPNPVSDLLTVSYASDFTNGTVIELFDALGKQVFTETLTSAQTEIRITVLDKGVYFYRLTEGSNTVKTGRVVKN